MVQDSPLHAELTRRQEDVLRLLLRGLAAAQVATALGLTEGTVRMHIKNLHQRCGTRNLHGLVMWALAHKDCCRVTEDEG